MTSVNALLLDLILTGTGVQPQVPDPANLKYNDPGFDPEIHLMVGQRAYNVDDDVWFYRTKTKIVKFKHVPSNEVMKLLEIEANANNYIHPSTHTASIVTETEERVWVSPLEKLKWNRLFQFSTDDINGIVWSFILSDKLYYAVGNGMIAKSDINGKNYVSRQTLSSSMLKNLMLVGSQIYFTANYDLYKISSDLSNSENLVKSSSGYDIFSSAIYDGVNFITPQLNSSSLPDIPYLRKYDNNGVEVSGFNCDTYPETVSGELVDYIVEISSGYVFSVKGNAMSSFFTKLIKVNESGQVINEIDTSTESGDYLNDAPGYVLYADKNEKIIKSFSNKLLRYNSDLSLDAGFNELVLDGTITTVVEGTSGGYIVGGDFSEKILHVSDSGEILSDFTYSGDENPWRIIVDEKGRLLFNTLNQSLPMYLINYDGSVEKLGAVFNVNKNFSGLSNGFSIENGDIIKTL